MVSVLPTIGLIVVEGFVGIPLVPPEVLPAPPPLAGVDVFAVTEIVLVRGEVP